MEMGDHVTDILTDRYNRLSGGVEGGSCAQHVFALVHCRWILHQTCRSGARTCTSCMCALLAPVLSPKTGASTRYRLVSEFQHPLPLTNVS